MSNICGIAVLAVVGMSTNLFASVAGFDINGPAIVARDGIIVMNEPHWVPPVYKIVPVTQTTIGNGVFETDFGAITLDGPDGTEFTATGGKIVSSTSQLYVQFQADARITGEANNPLYEHSSELLINATSSTGSFPLFDPSQGGTQFPFDGVTFTAASGDTYTFQPGSELSIAPEPGSLTILGLGCAALTVGRRRRCPH